jgi:hypothetical protein
VKISAKSNANLGTYRRSFTENLHNTVGGSELARGNKGSGAFRSWPSCRSALEAFFGEIGAPSTSRSGHKPKIHCRKPHFAALNDDHNSIWRPDNGAVVEQFSAKIIARNLVPPKHDHIFEIRHSWRF